MLQPLGTFGTKLFLRSGSVGFIVGSGEHIVPAAVGALVYEGLGTSIPQRSADLTCFF